MEGLEEVVISMDVLMEFVVGFEEKIVPHHCNEQAINKKGLRVGVLKNTNVLITQRE